jgi:AraC family transcriptional regulator, transcriptional activator FtrA
VADTPWCGKLPPTTELQLSMKTSPNKKIAAAAQPSLLAIIAYNELRTFEYAIAAEVFALERPGLGVPWYQTVVVAADAGPMHGIAGVLVQGSAPMSILKQAQTIVIPGWRDIAKPPSAQLLQELSDASQRGARILSICSGAFVLAAAGLLDGRRATTHWLYMDALRELYPQVHVETDQLYVDEGNIITSAGSAAGIDACLHLVRRDFGARVANIVARRMVTAPHREGGQAQYVETPVNLRHESKRRENMGGLLAWAKQHLNEPIGITEMAARVLMSERSFLRHFFDATGLTPGAWLQQERVAHARALLESTALPLEAIGVQCGYVSPETFRSAFKRALGVAPGAYRLRFRA